ncbi:MAG: 8-amino-7-oxononanoate synthase [Actinobacteria bacterium]|nr:8-amino-7-oxononanoate synthase [Actinomycetota bacterium]
MTSWADWVDGELDGIRAADRWRAPVATDGADPRAALISFASNDYLGLTQHRAVVAAAHAALDESGAGSGSARLVVGSREAHHALEAELADWKGTERAVLFATGYQTNLAVLSTFGGRGTRIVSDELNHASIIDGCRLSKAEVTIYDHADVEHAASLLQGASRAVLVTDSVFSMDGDAAPLDDLAQLARSTGALLVVDEAHAVLGPDPKWSADDELAFVRVGTLSKTLGSLGGFVAASAAVCDLLVNRARPYIFTTASTPADTAAARAALAVLRSSEGEALLARLAAHVKRVCPGHRSPIVPIVLGDEQAALDAAAFMADRGLLVPAIRPPTVPVGTSRLRVALSAAHTDDEVTQLVHALKDLDVST